jgi:hypothetical protein
MVSGKNVGPESVADALIEDLRMHPYRHQLMDIEVSLDRSAVLRLHEGFHR